MFAFARDLVAIPTENPPATDYAVCVERICRELETLGLEYELVETGTSAAPRQSVLAVGGERPPRLYLHGHYDVVPASSPRQFEAEVRDGRLVGRGASDMKGGLAAIVHAAAAAVEGGARVGVVLVPDEETGGRLGAERLAELGKLERGVAGAILAEPTWGTIWHACRGAFTLQLTTRGRAAHVGLHYEGLNAFEMAVATVEALRPLQEALKQRLSGLPFASDDIRARQSIMLVGGVAEGGANFNIVPDRFTFTLDRRPNADEDYAEAKRELLDALASAASRDGVELQWEVLQDARSASTPPDGPLVRTLGEAVARATGRAPTLTCCPGVLEARVYDALGIPAVAFGPGLIERMHAPDEDVPLANLVTAAAAYTQVALALAR